MVQSNVVQSPILPKKQDNRTSSWGGGWRRQERKGEGGGGQNLKKGGRQYGRVYIKLGGLGPFCQLDHRYYESGIISSSNIIL